MSISVAPSSTARAASTAFTADRCAPEGNPMTVHTAMVAGRMPAASGSRLGETQTAATPSSAASWHSRATWSAVAVGAKRV